MADSQIASYGQSPPKRRRLNSVSAFNDPSTSDVVIRFLWTGVSEELATSTVKVDVYSHQNLLVENSSFFAAQLSDRWAHGCERDADDRPILVVRDCYDLEDFVVAVRKLYEGVPGKPDRNPAYTFASFEDAFRCLVPADRLGFSLLHASAVAYLDSIPWTLVQHKELAPVVDSGRLSCAEVLLERTRPLAELAEERWTKLVNDLLSTAFASNEKRVRAEICLVIEQVWGATSSEDRGPLAAIWGPSLRSYLSEFEKDFLSNKFDEIWKHWNGFGYIYEEELLPEDFGEQPVLAF